MPENTKIAYKCEMFFFAYVPYVLSAWQKSLDLSKINNLREMVFHTFRKLEQVFYNRQYDRYIELTQMREDNMAICMYLSEDEKRERTTELINLINTGFQIVPVPAHAIMIKYGYNKLVTLKNQDGDSALILRNNENGGELIIDVQFHLAKGETELTII
jgi:hypothetical protein